jgi:hypothetical protein
MNTELKTTRKQYVTVEEAQLLCNRSERTIRRWIQKEYVRTTGDTSSGIYIDLDDLLRMQTNKPDTVHPVRNEIKRLASRDEDLHQRLDALMQQVDKLEDWLSHLLQMQGQEGAPLGNRVLRSPSSHSAQSSVERRGLTPGTQRLVTFAEQHKVTVGHIKGLYHVRLIELTVYQREGEAVRNRQEWWIDPSQHTHLVRYWQEHHIDHTPCPLCQGCVEHVQETGRDTV